MPAPDLRGPLSVVRGIVSFLRVENDVLAVDEREALWEALDRQAARLWTMVEDRDVIDLDELTSPSTEVGSLSEPRDPQP